MRASRFLKGAVTDLLFPSLLHAVARTRDVLGGRRRGSALMLRLVPGGQRLQNGQHGIDAWVERIGIHATEPDIMLCIEHKERSGAHALSLTKDAIAACHVP